MSSGNDQLRSTETTLETTLCVCCDRRYPRCHSRPGFVAYWDRSVSAADLAVPAVRPDDAVFAGPCSNPGRRPFPCRLVYAGLVHPAGLVDVGPVDLVGL